MNQQDEDKSSQQFETRSIEVQKVNDGRLMPEASKETERSYLFKTNNLLVKAGIALDERVVDIKEIQDYSCNKGGVLDYFLFQEVECLAQLEMTEFDKEELLREIELIRRITLKVSQRKTSTRKRRRSSSKIKTKIGCESEASGARQHKIWGPGEKKKTEDIDDELQNKMWDPGKQ